jgi:hypothetical protein
MDPIEGFKKGNKGLFKGVITGVTGMVTKPLSGALDAVKKTTDGI